MNFSMQLFRDRPFEHLLLVIFRDRNFKITMQIICGDGTPLHSKQVAHYLQVWLEF